MQNPLQVNDACRVTDDLLANILHFTAGTEYGLDAGAEPSEEQGSTEVYWSVSTLVDCLGSRPDVLGSSSVQC